MGGGCWGRGTAASPQTVAFCGEHVGGVWVGVLGEGDSCISSDCGFQWGTRGGCMGGGCWGRGTAASPQTVLLTLSAV